MVFKNVNAGTTLTINPTKDYWLGTPANYAGTIQYLTSDFNGLGDSVSVTIKGASAGVVGVDAQSTNTISEST